jgi:hypothetical protein
MSNHVFKIKFTKPSIELADDYERLSDNDKLKISELEVLSSYDYDDIEDYENYNCIMIAPPLIIASYRRILQENMIEHDCIDITDDVIKHNIELKAPLRDEFDKFDIFSSDLDDLIYENLDIDIILDRISKVGVEGLTHIEKKYLDR